jgi:hypothetical protein
MFKVKYGRYNPNNGETTRHESRVCSQAEASQIAANLKRSGADYVEIVRWIPTGAHAS